MKKFFFTLALALPLFVLAQERPQSPIPVELLFGNNRTVFQLSLNKPIVGKFRYNNISIATAPYQSNKEAPELTMVNSFIYQFHPCFGASGGLQYHFKKGFVPNIAFHCSYANPTWLLLLTPYLNFLPTCNSETIALIEFKPQLNGTFRLYSRAMSLYNYSITERFHDRSFYYFRLGLSCRKYTFGAGANFDYYGPRRIYKDNFGGFLRVVI